MISNNRKLYVDLIIIDALFNNYQIFKEADGDLTSNLSGLTEKIQNYLKSKGLLDSDNKLESLMKALEPEFIYLTLSAIGIPFIGMAFALAINVFDIDVHSIFKSVYDAIVPSLQSNSKVSPGTVDAVAQQAAQTQNTPIPEDENIVNIMKNKFEDLNKKIGLGSSKEIRYLEISLLTNNEIIKNAQLSFISRLFARKTLTTGIVGGIVGWIFKIILGAFGFMVASDAIKEVIKPKSPSASTEKISDGNTPQVLPRYNSKQHKFDPNPSYTEIAASDKPWIENFPNNDSGIEQMLISFAKEVYQGLNDKDSIIRSSPIFQKIVDNISYYNRSASGSPFTFVPRNLNSKKQIVDYFIDEVANKSS